MGVNRSLRRQLTEIRCRWHISREKAGAIQREQPVGAQLLSRISLCQRFQSGAQPVFGRDWKITLCNASSPSVGIHSGLSEGVRVASCETSRHASSLRPGYPDESGSPLGFSGMDDVQGVTRLEHVVHIRFEFLRRDAGSRTRHLPRRDFAADLGKEYVDPVRPLLESALMRRVVLHQRGKFETKFFFSQVVPQVVEGQKVHDRVRIPQAVETNECHSRDAHVCRRSYPRIVGVSLKRRD